jgi:hypothetical protein
LERGRIADAGPIENQDEFILEFIIPMPRAVNLIANGGRDAEFLAHFADERFRG